MANTMLDSAWGVGNRRGDVPNPAISVAGKVRGRLRPVRRGADAGAGDSRTRSGWLIKHVGTASLVHDGGSAVHAVVQRRVASVIRCTRDRVGDA